MHKENGKKGKGKLRIDKSKCPYVELYRSNRKTNLEDEDYSRVKEAIRILETHEEELRRMRQDLSIMFMQRYYKKHFSQHRERITKDI
jgi:hypothetical protein